MVLRGLEKGANLFVVPLNKPVLFFACGISLRSARAYLRIWSWLLLVNKSVPFFSFFDRKRDVKIFGGKS